MLEGIFLINKPKGITSHDVVWKIKKKFNLKKVGHTGTLDPFAEGLLIILVNKATKVAFLFEKLDKKYEGEIIFNKNYDTLDITGKLIKEKRNNILNYEKVKKSFDFFNEKEYLQIPPMYSAIKLNGLKMYDLARKNININIPPRKVKIHYLKINSNLENNKINFITKVSKGTYIRSLARDIGEKINTYGALKNLVRLKIGKYSIKNSKTINKITENDLINIKNLFSNYKKIFLNDYLIKLVKNGIFLDQRQIITNKSFIVLDNNNNWVAYYKPIEKNKYEYRPILFF
ncbi:tRNA pseudouridine(55) synthase TruB [Texas Phoenix palm phytoplasma]|uniref:tRNA pseudouridine synthase B n=1 Tax=Texas Phoenix palm phytoplasma TaxID=176709 RepID=A0ABS5BIF7_9MOLU|nr:tRNA pseudouridine(55) synthase TruB [Texas Phoenix palm phytoplasma]MBP3059362.1 tRNA pseudouridine(55) synthase TruB [Texas Phoenix palm phytoplasma]